RPVGVGGGGVLHEGAAAGIAADPAAVGHPLQEGLGESLHALPAAAVDIRKAQHMRRQRSGRIAPDIFGHEDQPRQRRPFRPHITLARVKFCRDPQPVRQAIEQLATTVFGRCLASQLTVYSSLLTRSGPVYQAMARCDLGG
ncbi:MAG: 2'-5' RNA ligase family protein, partial [Planctomycetota bacterium]